VTRKKLYQRPHLLIIVRFYPFQAAQQEGRYAFVTYTTASLQFSSTAEIIFYLCPRQHFRVFCWLLVTMIVIEGGATLKNLCRLMPRSLTYWTVLRMMRSRLWDPKYCVPSATVRDGVNDSCSAIP